MRTIWTRRLGIALGAVLAVDCVVESWSHRDDGLVFWFGTTFTASLLVLSGAVPRWENPFVGAALVAVGGALGLLPTAWTVVIPLFIVGVVATTLIDAGLTADERKAELGARPGPVEDGRDG
jgi:hypothetical protein